ncbi:unnamed protein product [Blepharisma stoltei]|uniref:Cyclin N-terminal domain-containing protein n=1 Tax=Blepharisma stoltei TaxID=1481888 RepID=A0AAU9JJK3_9CILI|nr:unnamed protein product [Blepharisma stoltei]
MGCTCPLGEASHTGEETLLRETEQSLGFTKIHSGIYNRIISDNSNGSLITEEKLIEAYASLSLSTEFLDSKLIPSHYFYKYLRAGKRDYNISTLVCAAILLGDAEDAQKIQVLFKNYDRTDEEKLENDDIDNLVGDMIKVTNAIIEVAKKMNPNQILLLESYRIVLNSGKEQLGKYLNFILSKTNKEENISLEGLVGAFNDPILRKALNAKGLREVLVQSSAIGP